MGWEGTVRHLLCKEGVGVKRRNELKGLMLLLLLLLVELAAVIL